MINLIVCLPGMGHRLKHVLELFHYCWNQGIHAVASPASRGSIYINRQLCLGGDVLKGRHQKPFQGKLEYDYILWIDSDIRFTPNDFQQLLNRNVDIVSALYHFEGGIHYACGMIDHEYFKKYGHPPYDEEGAFKGISKPVERDFVGMGFMLVKRGVYEKLEYPWHPPVWFTYEDLGINDFSGEDYGFCVKAKEAGFKVLVDPTVEVGHIKEAIY